MKVTVVIELEDNCSEQTCKEIEVGIDRVLTPYFNRHDLTVIHLEAAPGDMTAAFSIEKV